MNHESVARFILALVAGLILGSCDAPEPQASGSAVRPAVPNIAVGSVQKTARPNILLIVLDTTRRDRLSSYGYERETSPVLERLAGQGVIYENAISSGSWTLPAHASLFTGLFPREHFTTIETMRLDGSFTTLAELLRDEGYRTAAFTCNAWVGPHSGLDQGFETFDQVWKTFDQENGPDYHGAFQAKENALAWIDEPNPDARPFFVFVNFLEPHAPYRPRGSWRDKFLSSAADPADVEAVLQWKTPHEFGFILDVPGYEVTPSQFEVADALYDGAVAYQDFRLGELLAGLEQRGLTDDTIVAVVADHGEQLGEHGLLDHKMSLYEENIRIPLLLRYPPRLPAGVRIQAAVQSHDLFPTLLQLAGIERERPWGSAPLPLRIEEDGVGRAFTFVEFGRPEMFLGIMKKEWPGADVDRFDREMRSIRGSRYKLIWTSNGDDELYDLLSDPEEQVNLAAELPQLRAELRRHLFDFHAGRMEMIWPTGAR